MNYDRIAMKHKTEKDPLLKRIHRKALMFNTREMQVFESYCKRYKIKNQSRFMRESIIMYILKQMEADNPTLFDDKPNLFHS